MPSMQIKNLAVTILAITLCLPLATALTINVRDNNTGAYLNASINITYNVYDSYQETANYTIQTVQKNTGSYYVTNASSNFYINYTKPDAAINATWESIVSSSTIINASLSNYSCWVQNSTVVQLKISGAQSSIIISCYNGTGWYDIYSNTGGISGSQFPYTDSSSLMYDGSNITSAIYLLGPTGYLWATGPYNIIPGQVGFIKEEKIYWTINSSNDLELAPSGSVTPARATNYTRANVTISAGGYTSTSLNNLDLSLSSYTFNLSSTNNVTFRVLDEITGAVINTSSIRLSSTVYGTNGTTTAGTVTFANLTYGLYTVTYNASGYSQREYRILLPSSNSETIILYLLSTADATTVRFTVSSTVNFRLSNATVYINKKNSSGTNYYLVATCTTDSNGQCVSNVNIIDTTYRFLVYYQGAFRADSLDTVVTGVEIPITVSLIADPLTRFFQLPQVSTSLTYTGGTATYLVADSYGNVQQGCVRVYRRTGFINTELNATCSTGASFTITTYANNSLGDENYAIGTVYVNGLQYQTNRVSEDNNDLAGATNTGLILLAVVFAVGITLAFKYAWDMTTSIVMFMVTTVLFWSVGMIQISSLALISFLILLMVFMVRNKQ